MGDEPNIASHEEQLEYWLSNPNLDHQLVQAIRDREHNPEAAVRAVLNSGWIEYHNPTEVLLWIGDSRIPILVNMVTDESDPEVRRIAAEALGWKLGHPQVIPALIRALGDQDNHVFHAAVTALSGNLYRNPDLDVYCSTPLNPDIAPAITPSLKHADVRVRVGVAIALSFGRDCSPVVTRTLGKGLAHRDLFIRRFAAHGAYWSNNAAVPGLVGAMQDPDPGVRFWSAALCAHTGLGDATQVALILLRSLEVDRELWVVPSIEWVLDDAITALGVAAVPAFLSQLENTEIAGKVAFLLWYRIGKAGLPGMLAARVDAPELRSNYYFVNTLVMIDGDKHIQEALESDLIEVRRAGIDVLSTHSSSQYGPRSCLAALRLAAAKETNDQLLDRIITGMLHRVAGVDGELALWSMVREEPDLRLQLAAVKGLGQARSSLLNYIAGNHGEIYHPLVVASAKALRDPKSQV